MKFQITAVIVAAFIFGFAFGHNVGQSSVKIIPLPPPHPVHPPVAAMESHGIDSDAIAGLSSMQQGKYTEAASFLKNAPDLKIFYAIALEGAGQSLEAKKILATDSDIEQVRNIGRKAFLEHNDILIAGPAYQLYLQMRPQPENREMMENAIRLWKEERKK